MLVWNVFLTLKKISTRFLLLKMKTYCYLNIPFCFLVLLSSTNYFSYRIPVVTLFPILDSAAFTSFVDAETISAADLKRLIAQVKKSMNHVCLSFYHIRTK